MSTIRCLTPAAILLGLLAILAVDGVDLGNDSGNFFRDQLTQDNSPQWRKNANRPRSKIVLVQGTDWCLRRQLQPGMIMKMNF